MGEQLDDATAVQVSIRRNTRPRAEWPQETLDVGALRRAGWRPLPFQQFILKLTSRCNLACDYCYVYQGADQSWRDRPVRMQAATVRRTAERIAEHALTHALLGVEVVFHGGEPLLAGPEALGSAAATLRQALSTVPAELELYLQTNGTLLTEPMLDVLREHRVRVGVSLDGDPATHDAHRSHPNGKGSHADLVRALGRLRSKRYRELFAGVLCVVDPCSDPVATYEHLLSFEPPALDLLLPHANSSDQPVRSPGSSPANYGEWLAAVFDRWYLAPRRETSIRYFDEIIRGILGHPSRVESIGLTPARLVVVETDGRIEQSDALKSAYEGACATGMDIERHSFDDVLSVPGIVARQLGVDALDATCRRCELLGVCGGGFYPHRYRQGAGFRNPSVYCDDIALLIRHIHSRMLEDLAPVLPA